jgi:hypothetical protein
VDKEYVCESFCFGFRGRRWKIGSSVMINENEEQSLPAHFRKHFVTRDKFVMPDTTLAGGPRVDGVLKAPVKITDTAMSPDTRRMLGRDKTEPQEETGEPHKIDALMENPNPVEAKQENIQQPMKRGRRLGSKNAR